MPALSCDNPFRRVGTSVEALSPRSVRIRTTPAIMQAFICVSATAKVLMVHGIATVEATKQWFTAGMQKEGALF